MEDDESIASVSDSGSTSEAEDDFYDYEAGAGPKGRDKVCTRVFARVGVYAHSLENFLYWISTRAGIGEGVRRGYGSREHADFQGFGPCCPSCLRTSNIRFPICWPI